jgi:4-diphosphocytidyl-2-C-methyl-D-erythritol kinase
MGAAHQRALAKLTLHLRVVGVRPDRYHLLESEMVTVDLADHLEFEEGDGLEVRDMTGGPAEVPRGPANLVGKAMLAAGRRALVRLEKRIPVGAGLGGGSADAAAVLRWAGVTDAGVAASVGADVPFCLSGGRALVSGAGEVVEPLPFEERSFVVLLVPLAVDTASVYRAWDELGETSRGSNDLEWAAIAVEPRLEAWRDRFAELTGRTPKLAGSGSSWFVEGSLEGTGLEGVETLEVSGCRARVVTLRTAR